MRPTIWQSISSLLRKTTVECRLLASELGHTLTDVTPAPEGASKGNPTMADDATAPAPAAAPTSISGVVSQAKAEVSTLWTKFKAWFGAEVKTVEVVITADEQKFLTVLKPLLGAAEASAMTDLSTAVKAILVTLGGDLGNLDINTLETTVLNNLSKVEPELLAIAQGLGSQAFQALIKLLIASL